MNNRTNRRLNALHATDWKEGQRVRHQSGKEGTIVLVRLSSLDIVVDGSAKRRFVYNKAECKKI